MPSGTITILFFAAYFQQDWNRKSHRDLIELSNLNGKPKRNVHINIALNRDRNRNQKVRFKAISVIESKSKRQFISRPITTRISKLEIRNSMSEFQEIAEHLSRNSERETKSSTHTLPLHPTHSPVQFPSPLGPPTQFWFNPPSLLLFFFLKNSAEDLVPSWLRLRGGFAAAAAVCQEGTIWARSSLRAVRKSCARYFCSLLIHLEAVDLPSKPFTPPLHLFTASSEFLISYFLTSSLFNFANSEGLEERLRRDLSGPVAKSKLFLQSSQKHWNIFAVSWDNSRTFLACSASIWKK